MAVALMVHWFWQFLMFLVGAERQQDIWRTELLKWMPQSHSAESQWQQDCRNQCIGIIGWFSFGCFVTFSLSMYCSRPGGISCAQPLPWLSRLLMMLALNLGT